MADVLPVCLFFTQNVDDDCLDRQQKQLRCRHRENLRIQEAGLKGC